MKRASHVFAGEHTRPGCGGTRPAFRRCAWHARKCLKDFGAPGVFREARKTAPGAGALPNSLGRVTPCASSWWASARPLTRGGGQRAACPTMAVEISAP
jgi:hypothetical protein